MLKNYFRTAWRNLLRSKFLILLWVNDERSYE
jgi:hypothetical protein